MTKIIITESERERILNMHKSATSRQYLSEQYLSEQSIQDVQSGQGVIKKGSKGDPVKVIQKALNITVDGDFGPNTEAAVKTFQKNNGLKVDGIVGKNTLQNMVDVLNLELNNIVDAGNQVASSEERKSSAYIAGQVFGEGVKKYVITVGKVIMYVVVGRVSAIIYVGGQIIKTTVEFAKKVISFLGNVVETGVREVRQFNERVQTTIVNGLKSAGIAVEKGAKAIWDGIGRLKDNSVALLQKLMDGLKQMGAAIYAKALMLAGKAFEGYSTIQSYLKQKWSQVQNTIGQTWEDVTEGLSQGVSWFKEKAAQSAGAVKDFFQGFISVFESYLKNEKLIMEMSIYGVLAEMQYNPGKITLKG